mmetsp:Transcript_127373/g.238100  ORF Transcript_127373/g.238100 Transcript_127373/m.238100 type:complete len:235 (-) Transcript_127373:109-813(-)
MEFLWRSFLKHDFGALATPSAAGSGFPEAGLPPKLDWESSSFSSLPPAPCFRRKLRTTSWLVAFLLRDRGDSPRTLLLGLLSRRLLQADVLGFPDDIGRTIKEGGTTGMAVFRKSVPAGIHCQLGNTAKAAALELEVFRVDVEAQMFSCLSSCSQDETLLSCGRASLKGSGAVLAIPAPSRVPGRGLARRVVCALAAEPWLPRSAPMGGSSARERGRSGTSKKLLSSGCFSPPA